MPNHNTQQIIFENNRHRRQGVPATKRRPSVFDTLNKKKAFYFSLVAGLIVTLILLWNSVDSETLKVSSQFHPLLSYVVNVAMSFLMYVLCFYGMRINRSKVLRVLSVALGCFAIALVFAMLNAVLSGWIFQDGPQRFSSDMLPMKDILLIGAWALLAFCVTGIFNRYKLKLEVERLRTSNALISYDALQKQLDPHFLFNALTTLDGLMKEDVDKASEYLHHLAKIFRNTSAENRPITLSEELQSAESFLYILKMRYEGNLKVEQHINDSRMNDYVLRFSIQTLIENVVKHNVISSLHPMLITIETTDHDTVKVTNYLQERKAPSTEGRSRIGLRNLDLRYYILFRKHIKETKEDGRFVVEIPIISPADAKRVVATIENIVDQPEPDIRSLI